MNIWIKVLEQTTDGYCQSWQKMQCVGDGMVYNLFKEECISSEDVMEGLFQPCMVQFTNTSIPCSLMGGGSGKKSIRACDLTSTTYAMNGFNSHP